MKKHQNMTQTIVKVIALLVCVSINTLPLHGGGNTPQKSLAIRVKNFFRKQSTPVIGDWASPRFNTLSRRYSSSDIPGSSTHQNLAIVHRNSVTPRPMIAQDFEDPYTITSRPSSRDSSSLRRPAYWSAESEHAGEGPFYTPPSTPLAPQNIPFGSRRASIASSQPSSSRRSLLPSSEFEIPSPLSQSSSSGRNTYLKARYAQTKTKPPTYKSMIEYGDNNEAVTLFDENPTANAAPERFERLGNGQLTNQPKQNLDLYLTKSTKGKVTEVTKKKVLPALANAARRAKTPQRSDVQLTKDQKDFLQTISGTAKVLVPKTMEPQKLKNLNTGTYNLENELVSRLLTDPTFSKIDSVNKNLSWSAIISDNEFKSKFQNIFNQKIVQGEKQEQANILFNKTRAERAKNLIDTDRELKEILLKSGITITPDYKTQETILVTPRKSTIPLFYNYTENIQTQSDAQ